jgi:FkbM family methyltransferase
MKSIKQIVLTLIPAKLLKRLRKFRADYFDIYALKSYSQEGEDMILRRVFEERNDGFYIDVGAHHPRRFSNTYFFYRRGWMGINIDAMPGSMELFAKLRPRDINIEYAVGTSEGEAKYFVFNDPALNSFNEDLSSARNGGPYQILQELLRQVMPLRSILAEHLPAGRKIDFLTVDVEGMDLDVLQSNDWDLFRPRYVLVECFGLDLAQLSGDAVYDFLVKQEYRFVAKTINTALFCDARVNECAREGSPVY